jgi:hypothetical protein
MLGEGGSGPLLLSGGRLVNRGGVWDIRLWVSSDGMGVNWEEHSISYQHNLLEENVTRKFNSKVNTTEGSYADTSLMLIDSGKKIALMTYSMNEPMQAGFSMRIEFP